MRRRTLLELGAASGALWLGCSSSPSLVPLGGKLVDPNTIDRDPMALLPSGLVGFFAADLASVYSSPVGADFAAIAQTLVPIGNEANFNVARDTLRVVGGAYAMQGADFCAVTQGRFDVAAIARAADGRAASPSGVPLIKSRYREFDLYTVGNIGFTVLTPQTLLSGNETGMRRALDRLRLGKLERQVPAWMIALSETQGAPLVVAGDFGADSVLAKPVFDPKKDGVPRDKALEPNGSAATPVLEAASANFPFLSGLRALRVLGNFQPPGLNFAGALTYESEEKAHAGAASIRNLSDMAQWANMLSIFGFGSSLPPAKLAVQGQDLAIVQPVDTQLAKTVLSMISSYLKRA